METLERIKARRSIRKFRKEPVSRQTIREIVAASAYAPSWKNTQTTRYLVVDDAAKMQEIAEHGVMGFAFNRQTILGAAAVVAVCSVGKRSGYERDGSYTTAKKDKWEMFDAGIACQTFMLAASELGVGSVLLGIFDEAALRSILSLPEEQNLSALICIGYSDETPSAPPRKTPDELLKFF